MRSGNTVAEPAPGHLSPEECRAVFEAARPARALLTHLGPGVETSLPCGSDGQTIRVPVPELSAERREELAKVAHRYAEQARVSVRNVRRDGMDRLKKMEKDGEISKDEHHLWAEEIQTLTDDHIKEIDTALAQKDEEILQV